MEEQAKRDEQDRKLKEDLARSLQKRTVVVPEQPEFVPGVEIEAQKKFREGVIALYSAMDYGAAKTAFEQAVSADKNFLEAYFNLGMVYERTGQPEEAIKVYQSALSANPESGAAKSYIGKVYLAKAKEAFELNKEADGQKLMTEAKGLLDQVLMKDTDNVEANNALALYWLLRAEREPDPAKHTEYLNRGEEFIKNVLVLQPVNVIALNTRGLIYLERGEYEIARWVFENKVLKLDRASNEAHNNLGLAYFKMGDTPKAVYHFKTALQLNADNLVARLNLAAIYLNYLNYEAAKEQYEYVLNARPDNIEATIGMGSSLIGMQQYEEGFKYYRKAVAVAPAQVELLMRIGKTWQTRLSEFDKAVEAYDEYIRLAGAMKLDVSEAQKAIEQARKMQEQMKKMEEQMKVEEAEAKKHQEEMKAKIKELESELKILESKAGQYSKALVEKKDAIKASKKMGAEERATLKRCDDLLKKFSVVDPAMKEIRENIQFEMMDEAQTLITKLFGQINPALLEAESVLQIEKVLKEGAVAPAPEAAPAAAPAPAAEQPKAEQPKAEQPKAEEKKAEPAPAAPVAPAVAPVPAPAAEKPKAEQPKAEEKKAEPAPAAPVAPAVAPAPAPAAEQPKAEEKRIEPAAAPAVKKVDAIVVPPEEPKAEEKKAEEKKTEELKKEEPKVEPAATPAAPAVPAEAPKVEAAPAGN